jgi:hypothetical protein
MVHLIDEGSGTKKPPKNHRASQCFAGGSVLLVAEVCWPIQVLPPNVTRKISGSWILRESSIAAAGPGGVQDAVTVDQ